MRETERAVGSHLLYSSERPESRRKRPSGFDLAKEALQRILPESPLVKEISTFDKRSLQTILEWAYGPKDWKTTNQDSEWNYVNPNPETKIHWLHQVKGTYRNLKAILEWVHDPETREHLDPAPGVPVFDSEGNLVGYNPVNFEDEKEIDRAVADLARYYYNGGEPEKITTLLSVNQKGKALGAITIRWRGVAYGPQKHKFAYIERWIDNPKIRGRGVGGELLDEALRIAKDKNYREVRTWVMTDVDSVSLGRVLGAFFSRGFEQLSGPDSDWGKYVERRIKEGKQMPPTNREAKQLILRGEDGEEIEGKKKESQPQETPNFPK